MTMKEVAEFTTVIGCRNNCVYCPQSATVNGYKNISNDKMMSLNTFMSCLKRIRKSTIICFGGFSEPWFNPDCTLMVLLAYLEGYKIQINSTLVGMSLKDLECIKKIPFNSFMLHLMGEDEHWTSLDEYLVLLDFVLKNRFKNLLLVYMNVPNKKTLELIHQYGYTANSLRKISRAGLINTGKHKTFFKNKKRFCNNVGIGFFVCSENRLNKPIILPNGDLVLCCMDFSLQHNLGNLLNVSKMGSIFEQKIYRSIIHDFKHNNGRNIICGKCECYVPLTSKYIVLYLLDCFTTENMRRFLRRVFVHMGLYNVWRSWVKE